MDASSIRRVFQMANSHHSLCVISGDHINETGIRCAQKSLNIWNAVRELPTAASLSKYDAAFRDIFNVFEAFAA